MKIIANSSFHPQFQPGQRQKPDAALRFGQQTYDAAFRDQVKKGVMNDLLKDPFLSSVPISPEAETELKRLAAAHGTGLSQFFAAAGKPLTITPEAWALRTYRTQVVMTLKFAAEPDEERLLKDVRNMFENPAKHLKAIGPRT
jgi:hypothetical protein